MLLSVSLLEIHWTLGFGLPKCGYPGADILVAVDDSEVFYKNKCKMLITRAIPSSRQSLLLH